MLTHASLDDSSIEDSLMSESIFSSSLLLKTYHNIYKDTDIVILIMISFKSTS